MLALQAVSSAAASGSASVVTQIAAGSNSGAGGFGADASYSGGTANSYAGAVVTSAVNNPAPAAVYQTERAGTFTYTLGGLTAGQVYTARLHFAKNQYSAPEQRQFNVTVNGLQVLTNFDIWAAAGGANRALVRAFCGDGQWGGTGGDRFRRGLGGSAESVGH